MATAMKVAESTTCRLVAAASFVVAACAAASTARVHPPGGAATPTARQGAAAPDVVQDTKPLLDAFCDCTRITNRVVTMANTTGIVVNDDCTLLLTVPGRALTWGVGVTSMIIGNSLKFSYVGRAKTSQTKLRRVSRADILSHIHR